MPGVTENANPLQAFAPSVEALFQTAKPSSAPMAPSVQALFSMAGPSTGSTAAPAPAPGPRRGGKGSSRPAPRTPSSSKPRMASSPSADRVRNTDVSPSHRGARPDVVSPFGVNPKPMSPRGQHSQAQSPGVRAFFSTAAPAPEDGVTLGFEERLGTQILEYARDVQAATAAVKVAIDADGCLSRVRACVRKLWAQASVEIFGSYGTGLWLPSSDIDLVILGIGDSAQRGPDGEAVTMSALLSHLAAVLQQEPWAVHVRVLTSATMPVLKMRLECSESSVTTSSGRGGSDRGGSGRGGAAAQVGVDIDITIDLRKADGKVGSKVGGPPDGELTAASLQAHDAASKEAFARADGDAEGASSATTLKAALDIETAGSGSDASASSRSEGGEGGGGGGEGGDCQECDCEFAAIVRADASGSRRTLAGGAVPSGGLAPSVQQQMHSGVLARQVGWLVGWLVGR